MDLEFDSYLFNWIWTPKYLDYKSGSQISDFTGSGLGHT